MEYCSPQSKKGSDMAPLSVKKSALQPGMRGYKLEKMDWVTPTQHEVVDSAPGTPEKGAYIFKK